VGTRQRGGYVGGAPRRHVDIAARGQRAAHDAQPLLAATPQNLQRVERHEAAVLGVGQRACVGGAHHSRLGRPLHQALEVGIRQHAWCRVASSTAAADVAVAGRALQIGHVGREGAAHVLDSARPAEGVAAWVKRDAGALGYGVQTRRALHRRDRVGLVGCDGGNGEGEGGGGMRCASGTIAALPL